MKIKPIRKEPTEYTQTIEEKLEILRLKINEIVKWINEMNYKLNDTNYVTSELGMNKNE